MHRVVVIGGGFAGTAAVKRLERRLPDDWEPVLISAENFMTYTPLLPEVAGASLLPGHAVAPIRRMLRRTRYYRARVEEIDLTARRIRYRSGKSHEMDYDHLVLAVGNTPDLDFMEGPPDRTLPLKTLGDALHIRNRMIIALERAEMEEDAAVRHRLTTFVVIGGGSSGVEVAGAIADFLRTAVRFYPHLKDHRGRVVLLEAGERLLGEFPTSLGESALRVMERDGIEVRLHTRVAAVTERGARTEHGDWIDAENLVCTIGTDPNPLLQELDIPRRKDLAVTEADMSVSDTRGLWAIGDCAVIRNSYSDEPCPPTAQFAVQQGRQLADNLVRTIQGEPTRPFHYRSRGELATIGHRRAVAYVFGLRLSGFPAWLCWRAVYLAMLPTWMRKLQVFSEWTLDLLFPRDITQLHFARSTPEAAESRKQEPLPRKAAHS